MVFLWKFPSWDGLTMARNQCPGHFFLGKSCVASRQSNVAIYPLKPIEYIYIYIDTYIYIYIYISKIAKSDERRPPITYLVPSVIPLSHHWMPFKHPHFFEIPKSPWNTGWNSYRKHRSCGRRCGEQDQESLGRAISCASKSQEILGEWNMAGKYISVMVIHGG